VFIQRNLNLQNPNFRSSNPRKDGVYPNKLGYQVMEAPVEKKIKEVFSKK